MAAIIPAQGSYISIHVGISNYMLLSLLVFYHYSCCYSCKMCDISLSACEMFTDQANIATIDAYNCTYRCCI